jgi:hypothetical protein
MLNDFLKPQAAANGQASGQASGDLIVAIKQLLDGLQKGGGVQIPKIAVPTNDLTSILQQVENILQKLNVNVVHGPPGRNSFTLVPSSSGRYSKCMVS